MTKPNNIIRDSRRVAKKLVQEMTYNQSIDEGGAEFWKWAAVEDYQRLLEMAPSLTPEEYETRLESVEIYKAQAERAGVPREWIDEQFYRIRQEWARDHKTLQSNDCEPPAEPLETEG